jgi:hypothetical protein
MQKPVPSQSIAVPAPRAPATLSEWLGDAKRHRVDAHEAARAAQKSGDHAGHVRWSKLETLIADLVAAQ